MADYGGYPIAASITIPALSRAAQVVVTCNAKAKSSFLTGSGARRIRAKLYRTQSSVTVYQDGDGDISGAVDSETEEISVTREFTFSLAAGASATVGVEQSYTGPLAFFDLREVMLKAEVIKA
jgi:hypothetical protein